MNFTRDVVEKRPPRATALIELTRAGSRREWSFAEVADRSARLAGTLRRNGVRSGDTVMIVVGNRSEWVFSMLACFRIGAVAFPCSEQLRPRDLAFRLRLTDPAIVICDERDRVPLEAAGPSCRVLLTPDEALFATAPVVAEELTPHDPALIVFTSGTSGEPKGVIHPQRYLTGQRLQATHWLGAKPGQVVWCTTASGWSKSARNVFLAPWLLGATAVLHDARFDRHERLELIARERVEVLCMSPTEYRMTATALDGVPGAELAELVSAGERLDPRMIETWQAATGLGIRDGYGQTETGHLTANPAGVPGRAGSMGRALPGISAWVENGELVVDSTTVLTFFAGYVGGERPTPERVWRTGDRVTQDEDGFFYFESRADDVIISAGYRIGPTEVESALLEHPAVADAAVVGRDDPERGAIVRAVLVLADGWEQSDRLTREIQNYVKGQTAPYKYPRVVDYVTALPRTSSGKLRRAELREEGP